MFFSFYNIFIYLLFVVGKYIGQIYKHNPYQISNSSFKAPVCSSSDYQTSSSIKLTTTYVSSVRYKKQNNSVLCSQYSIQNDVSITNNNDMQSYDKAKKQKYSIPTTSTPNHHAQCIANTSACMLNLHTTTGLPPVGKEYMCFQKDDKSDQAARCIKSRIVTKVIDYVLFIDTFEQQCVVLKDMLQSPRLKDHI